MTAEWTYITAMLVIAFDVGGPVALGLAGLARMGPAALAAPFVASLGDRFRRRDVLAISSAVRCLVLLGSAAAIAGGAGLAVIFALAAVDAIVNTGIRPAQGALMPQLAGDPRQLAAANTFVSAMFIGGGMVGSLLGGFVSASAGGAAAYAVGAALFAVASTFYAGLPKGAKPRIRRRVTDVLTGFQTAFSKPNLAAVVGFTAFVMLIRGISVPLFVLVATESLEEGAGGVGVVLGALGAGGLLGIAITVPLVRRGGGAATTYCVALVGAGVFLALTAVSHLAVVVIAMILIRGAFLAAADAAGVTLIQRNADDTERVRVLGIMESLSNGFLAIGAAVTPGLVVWLGVDMALVVSGLAVPVFAIAGIGWFRKLDAAAADRERLVKLIAAQPTFTALGLGPLDMLAAGAQPKSFEAGEAIVEQGAPAMAYYVMVSGHVDVFVDDARLGAIGPRGGFGEVALLNDTTRTATVRAVTDVETLQIDRMRFLAAIDPSSQTAEALTQIAGLRLGTSASPRPRLQEREWTAADRERLRTMVRHVRGLEGVPADVLESLVDRAAAYGAESGSLVTRIGDRAEVVWLVWDGEVVTSAAADEEQKLGPGAVFGEAAAADDCPLDATTTAVGSCQLVAIGAAAYRQAVRAPV